MRTDWIPLSASALVIGAMSLLFGSVLNPADVGGSSADTLRVATEEGARWLAMAVTYTLASVTLTLGLPAMLTLLDRRGRRLGLVGVTVFAVGAIGTCGYAMLMVFFRAMVVAGAVRGSGLEQITADKGLSVFLVGWIGAFYGGVLLIALALVRARTTPRWVPALLLAFVAMLPLTSHLGRVGSALQVTAFAVAFTGIAMAAVSGDNRGTARARPAY
jgi:hypothetical protein